MARFLWRTCPGESTIYSRFFPFSSHSAPSLPRSLLLQWCPLIPVPEEGQDRGHARHVTLGLRIPDGDTCSWCLHFW